MSPRVVRGSMIPERPLSLARNAVQALHRGALVLVVSSGLFILMGLLMALVAAPGAAVLYVSGKWVLAIPGGRPFYPTAFGGLFIGIYLLIASVWAGSFSRRASARIAGLRPTRVAAARSGARIAMIGRVIEGQPIDPAQVPEWLLAAHDGTMDGMVGYPIVIEDADGEAIRVEGPDGPEAPEEPRWNGWPGALVRLGAPVFALGELQRIQGTGGYRGGVAAWRLVKGAGKDGVEPDFRVRQGTQAGLVQEMRSGETSRWWGIAAAVMLVVGGVSVWMAQKT